MEDLFPEWWSDNYFAAFDRLGIIMIHRSIWLTLDYILLCYLSVCVGFFFCSWRLIWLVCHPEIHNLLNGKCTESGDQQQRLINCFFIFIFNWIEFSVWEIIEILFWKCGVHSFSVIDLIDPIRLDRTICPGWEIDPILGNVCICKCARHGGFFFGYITHYLFWAEVPRAEAEPNVWPSRIRANDLLCACVRLKSLYDINWI